MTSKHFLKSSFLFTSFSIFLIFSGCNHQKFPQGQRIYSARCSNCHMPDGNGLGKLIPSLHNDNLALNSQHVVCTILNGINADSLGQTISVMPAFPDMTAVEMTNLINYLTSEFWKSGEVSKISNITQLVNDCRNSKK